MARQRSIAFASFGRIGVIREDGSGEHYPTFDRAGQKSWALGPEFSDGRRIVLTSREETAIEKEVIGDLTTHSWILDTAKGGLEEILTRDRPSSYVLCSALLPGEERVLAAAMQDGEERLHTMRLDGSDRFELTRAGDGFHYGTEVSPDGRRVACHVTGGKFPDRVGRPPYPSYSICVLDLSSGARTVVVGHADHLYFAPTWSADARELAYVDCQHRKDPAHYWADLCVADVAAKAHRVVTDDRSHWFGTSYGPADNRGGGSNVTRWVGRSLSYTRKMPDSHPDCEHHPERPDHQENVYSPEKARGGTQICLIDPTAGAVRELTRPEEGRWDFRPCWSPDGARFVFARAWVGQPAELWVADADGGNARLLTRGHDGRGADHPRWISAAM